MGLDGDGQFEERAACEVLTLPIDPLARGQTRELDQCGGISGCDVVDMQTTPFREPLS